MLLEQVLYLAAAPLGVAASLAIVARRAGASAPVAWAVSTSGGYVAGRLVQAGRGGVDNALRSLVAPHDASQWLPHAVLMALGITLLWLSAHRAWRTASVVLGALLVVALPVRLLTGPVARQMMMLEKLLHIALVAATLGLLWLLLAAGDARHQERVRQALLILVSIGAALVLTQSGSFTYGAQCGILGAACAGCAICVAGGVSGAAGTIAIALGGVVVLGCYYASLAVIDAALVLGALAVGVGRLPDLGLQFGARQQSALRSGVCLVLLVLAVLNSWS